MKFFKKFDYVFVSLLIVGLLINPFSISALTTKYKAINIEATTAMILNGTTINDWGETGSFKIKVSSDDTTEDFLLSKLLGSSTITLTETNGGSNETYVTSVTALSIDTASLTDDGVTLDKLNSGTANRAFVTDGSGDPALELLDYDTMATKTQGNIIIYGASGIPENLATAGSGRILQSQGSGADPIWAIPHRQEIFTTPGANTWTASGVTSVKVICVGAGGGGGEANNSGVDGGGGGGGEYVEGTITVSGDITVTIGAGGAGGTGGGGGSTANDGSDGGNTTFGSLMTANGGDGGTGGTTGVPGPPGPGGTGGSITGLEMVKEDGTLGSGATAGVKGWGGAQALGRSGGDPGSAGAEPGAGGGGGVLAGSDGGAGADGICIVTS